MVSYFFRVRSHPLGVIVFDTLDRPGELLIAGEACCGVAVEELARIAGKTGKVEVAESAAQNCPLRRRR